MLISFHFLFLRFREQKNDPVLMRLTYGDGAFIVTCPQVISKWMVIEGRRWTGGRKFKYVCGAFEFEWRLLSALII